MCVYVIFGGFGIKILLFLPLALGPLAVLLPLGPACCCGSAVELLGPLVLPWGVLLDFPLPFPFPAHKGTFKLIICVISVYFSYCIHLCF